MTPVLTPTKNEQANGTANKNQKLVDSHNTAATHFEAAAKNHRDAAKHHEAGEPEKANEKTITAHGNQSLGRDAQKTAQKTAQKQNVKKY
ncbi:MAG: hypothetical protein NTX03_01220 [Bacteroidetes bacterium]|nr:hypothetical protein [Bacteroidota bacterium]